MPVPEFDLQRILRWCARETFPLEDLYRLKPRWPVTRSRSWRFGRGSGGTWTRVPVAPLRYGAQVGSGLCIGEAGTFDFTGTSRCPRPIVRRHYWTSQI